MGYVEFIETFKVGFTCKWIDSRPDGLMDDMPRNFKCRITCGRRGHTLYFSQGSGHTKEPTLIDVLDSIASDASGYENANSFEDWANEYGYDTDSRKAEKVWKAVKRGSEQLKRTIGEAAYDVLLWQVERE